MLHISSKMYRLKITARILVNFVQNKKVFRYLPILWDKKTCTERKMCLLIVFFSAQDCIKFFLFALPSTFQLAYSPDRQSANPSSLEGCQFLYLGFSRRRNPMELPPQAWFLQCGLFRSFKVYLSCPQ